MTFIWTKRHIETWSKSNENFKFFSKSIYFFVNMYIFPVKIISLQLRLCCFYWKCISFGTNFVTVRFMSKIIIKIVLRDLCEIPVSLATSLPISLLLANTTPLICSRLLNLSESVLTIHRFLVVTKSSQTNSWTNIHVFIC